MSSYYFSCFRNSLHVLDSSSHARRGPGGSAGPWRKPSWLSAAPRRGRQSQVVAYQVRTRRRVCAGYLGVMSLRGCGGVCGRSCRSCSSMKMCLCIGSSGLLPPPTWQRACRRHNAALGVRAAADRGRIRRQRRWSRPTPPLIIRVGVAFFKNTWTPSFCLGGVAVS